MQRKHLLQKRAEIIWSLISQQDYDLADVSVIMGIKHRSTVMRINDRMPKDWKSPWIKNIV